jgi:hypothetical protein
VDRSGLGLFQGTIRQMPGGTEETTKNVSEDSRFADRDLNPGPPEYEGVLSTQPRRSRKV